MWRRGAAAACALASAVSLGACASSSTPPSSQSAFVRADDVALRTVTLSEATAVPAVVEASRALGTTALSLAPQDQNAVVSPAGLATALAMLAEGVGGASLAELENVLGAPGAERRDAFAALRAALLEWDGDPASATGGDLPERPLVHLADEVVVHGGFPVHEDYLRALASGFDAGVQYADLSSASGKAVLDEWVARHTGGLIEESAITPNRDLKLVLQDAIVLAARWRTPFDASNTSAAPFRLGDGKTVDVETMSSHDLHAAYAEVDGWVALRLPYTDALHADVLLPPTGTDPAALTPDLLDAVSSSLDSAALARIGLALPTLDIAPPALDVVPMLPALGLGSLRCGSRTDLRGIADAELCLGQAAQQSMLTIDEDGTVAAAVTELGIVATSADVVDHEVAFDRPFIVSVSHTETGWPLFLAAVRDPRHG